MHQKWQELEDERIRNLPDPDCPPGMKVMGDGERVQTLAVLRENQRELRVLISKLPLVSQTMSSKRRKEAAEDRLKEVEEAILIFEKPKVYIKMDDE